jgi:hypothetical protein
MGWLNFCWDERFVWLGGVWLERKFYGEMKEKLEEKPGISRKINKQREKEKN